MDGGVREGKKWEKEREDRLLTSPAVRECGRVRCTQQSRQGRSGVVVRVQYGYGVVQQAQMLDVHAAWTPCIRGSAGCLTATTESVSDGGGGDGGGGMTPRAEWVRQRQAERSAGRKKKFFAVLIVRSAAAAGTSAREERLVCG